MSRTVIHVSEATGWTGGLARMLELSVGLRERGWRVLLACRPGSRIAQEALRLKLDFMTLPIRNDYDLASAWTLGAEASRCRAAIIHAHHPRAHGVALLAKIMTRLVRPSARPPALVVSRRVSYPVGRNAFSRWKYRSSQVDAYVAVAGAVRDILGAGGVEARRVEVIPSGVDPEEFFPRPADPRLLRMLGIPPGAPLVVKIANASPAKGIAVFLEAAAAVLKSHPETWFLLAGRDTTGDWVRRLVAQRGLLDRVVLAGFRTDIADLLACASVSVNAATAGEALSGALRESLAMDIPVVASDIAGNRELVEDRRTGLTVQPGDAAALAEALRWTLSHRDQACELARAGRRLVLAKYTVQRSVSLTEQLYLRLMKGG